jgi:hypothetical protein
MRSGNGMPQTLPFCLYSAQPDPDQIAAHDGFHRQRLEPLDHDGTAGNLIPFGRRNHRLGCIPGQLIRHDVGQFGEPEIGDSGEYPALAGMGVGSTTSKAERRSVVTISMRWSSTP